MVRFFFAPSARLSSPLCSVIVGLITLTGEVVPGVTCPTIRTDAGKTVALSHLPSQFELGDRVTVTGDSYAPSPICNQEVLVVTAAEPAS